MVGVSLWCARCLLFAEEAISQASPQSATNPKLAHPPLRNYGKPLHPRFSRSLQKTIRYFVRYFALDFFVKQAPAPPFTDRVPFGGIEMNHVYAPNTKWD